jgi:hypothetical protein
MCQRMNRESSSNQALLGIESTFTLGENLTNVIDLALLQYVCCYVCTVTVPRVWVSHRHGPNIPSQIRLAIIDP